MTVETRKARGSAAKLRADSLRRSGPSIMTALVEPNTLFREGLESILSRTRFHVAVRTATVAVLEAMDGGQKPPQMAVLWTEDGADSAISDITILKIKYTDCRVVCIGQSYKPEEIIDLLRAGADGVLLRSISADTFVKSLELVMLGERVIPAVSLNFSTLRGRSEPPEPKILQLDTEDQSKIQQGHRSSRLSVREYAILKCLVQGEANKIIALKLDIAEATVKVHVKAILRKIHVQNRTQAAIWALNHLAEIKPDDIVEGPAAGSNGAASPHMRLSEADTPVQLT